MIRRLAVLLGVMTAASVLTMAPAAAVGGEGDAWPSFTESSGCGAQRLRPPHADSTGWLSRETILRGPTADMFGRTVQQIFDELVRWEVPGSPEVLTMHRHTIPALEQVAIAIEERLDAGDRYRVSPDTTYGTAARTIAGQIRMSRHTFGIAMDLNAPQNPHRHDNVLITDMPEWWTQAFLDAGFCWGGLWIGSKDTMHFAWQGPAFTEGSELPLPYAPLTDPAALGTPDASVRVQPLPLPFTFATVLADGDGNSATDVIRLARSGPDVVVDVSVASRHHNACSARRSIAPGLAATAEQAVASGMGDWDGRGGQDLWVVTDDNGTLRLTVRWAFGGFTAETAATTRVTTPSSGAWVTTADVDADGALDLVIADGPSIAAWAIDPYSGATRNLWVRANPFADADHLMLGDDDLDNLPDLWAIEDGTVSVTHAANGWKTVDRRERPVSLPSRIDDAVVADYDGDGRRDLIVFYGTKKTVWLANTRLDDGLPLEVWFEYEEPDCDDDEITWNRQELRFSTSGWVAEGSYGWRSAQGLPVGCDPERDGCPIDVVTGRTFAEFLAWIDGLDAVGTDDDTAAARALRAAGYDTPCALDDEACWDEPMLRQDVSARFSIFLAQRRGDVPEPHRWVVTRTVEGPDRFPR